MKTKIILSVPALFLIISALGQKSTIELTFTAIYNSAYVQLDSINVTNETQGVDTVLYYPDNVLILDYGVGIHGDKNPGSGFRINQNYPNPVKDQTTISIYIPEEDNVSISVADIQGKSLLTSEMNLIRGNHSFRFMPGKGNMVFFTATWKGFTRYIKIIQSGSGFDKACKLYYSGYDGPGIDLKSQTEAMGFVFDLGDSLSYIGYATTPAGINGSDVQGDAPQSNETYIFEIIEGIPCPGIPAVNYEGQTYTTVQIGTQCWFKENLNIGSMIDSLLNQTNNGIIEKYCRSDDSDYCSSYGGLYQWAEVVQYLNGATNTTSWNPVPTGNVQGICPSGWHIPSDIEWCTLTTYIDPSVDCYVTGSSGTDIGGKMKETGTLNWDPPNLGATNESGFSTLPSSYRYDNGTFRNDKTKSHSWSATEYNGIAAWYRSIYTATTVIGRYGNIKIGGVPARCIKD